MRLPKIASVFVFLGCLAAYLIFVTHHYDGVRPAISKIPPHFHPRLGLSGSPNRPTSSEVVSGRSQYGVMFDAGSTGTRIHVFKFKLEDNEAPKLAHETFRAIKPGLSAYADDPEKCKEGILELLEVAQDSIPSSVWSSTPLVLKATAGLRLLPGEKATHLLDRVREVFVESPFLSRGDSVSIMDGADEEDHPDLTHRLHGIISDVQQHPHTLLTQLPWSRLDVGKTSCLGRNRGTAFRGQQHRASKSLLGPGLLWPMGTRRSSVYCEGPESSFVSVSGVPIYESCLRKVEKVLYRKVKKAEEAKDIEFYAFSYYYDRAVDLGAIDEKTGGIIKVSDYIDTAKRVCNGMTVTPRENPFLCLDLTYISTMLQELGFPKEKVFKLVRKIDEVETSWALGATFHYIESLHSQ
ncbi:ectonucleoside triphosphate diphosphohydrolase 6-like isoform 3-T4 [Salvelinus alpinus]